MIANRKGHDALRLSPPSMLALRQVILGQHAVPMGQQFLAPNRTHREVTDFLDEAGIPEHARLPDGSRENRASHSLKAINGTATRTQGTSNTRKSPPRDRPATGLLCEEPGHEICLAEFGVSCHSCVKAVKA